jgi:hypothetical protein
MNITYRIENVYRVWDAINGGSVTIQEDGDGCYDMDGVKFTVEQIPGIIRVLEQLKQNYDLENMSVFTPEKMAIERQRILNENVKSGRPDPPF